MIRAAVFDLDGTLADTITDLRTAMNGMLREFGFPELDRAGILAGINNGARHFVKASLPAEVRDDEALLDRAFACYEQHYAACYNDCTQPYDGIPELLSALAARGILLGVVSNKQDAFVRAIIEKIFDHGLFSYVAGQADLPAKPNPAVLYRGLGQLGVSTEETIYVGDSDIDVLTARAAGVSLAAVSWGYRNADVLRSVGARAIAATPEELFSLLTAQTPPPVPTEGSVRR